MRSPGLLFQVEALDLGVELLVKFRASRTDEQETGKPRTVAQLLTAARDRTELRTQQARERAEHARVLHEQEARAARERYLSDLEKQGQGVWNKVDQLVATKQ